MTSGLGQQFGEESSSLVSMRVLGTPPTSGRFEIHVRRAECGLRVSLTVASWAPEADGKAPLVSWNFWCFPYGEGQEGPPPANTLVGDGVLKPVTLRARYT